MHHSLSTTCARSLPTTCTVFRLRRTSGWLPLTLVSKPRRLAQSDERWQLAPALSGRAPFDSLPEPALNRRVIVSAARAIVAAARAIIAAAAVRAATAVALRAPAPQPLDRVAVAHPHARWRGSTHLAALARLAARLEGNGRRPRLVPLAGEARRRLQVGPEGEQSCLPVQWALVDADRRRHPLRLRALRR